MLIAATYFIYYKGSTEQCAKQLLLMEVLALFIQVGLNYFNYHSKSKIVILLTLFISSMILLGLLSSFFNFSTLCGFYAV